MTALRRKLLRDVWAGRRDALALVALVACAMTVFVGSVTTYRSLLISKDSYFTSHRLADAFVSLRRAPQATASALAAIEGVDVVETRVVADVPLSVEGYEEPVTARLVSLPTDGQPKLNRLFIARGRLPTPGKTWECVIGESFARAHGLAPGDRVRASIGKGTHALQIVGVGFSPEFVFLARPGDAMPDDHRFGVIWLARDELAAALDLAGAFNDAVLALAPGASLPGVLASVDRALAPYGARDAYGRDRHVPSRFLNDQIRQLKSTAVVVPVIFLLVAAFLLHSMLGRLVATQRTQIGLLKACGYGNAAVGLHYAGMAALIVLVGAVLGTCGGVLLSTHMTTLYAGYYHLPVFECLREIWVVLLGAALTLCAGLGGAMGAVRRVVRLPPAKAMRPPAPQSYRWKGTGSLGSLLPRSGLGRMTVRHIGRHPWRTASSSLGIALAIAILVVGLFFRDAMSFTIAHQFEHAQRADATVTFANPLPAAAIDELRQLPAVRHAEPLRAVPIRLRAGGRQYQTVLIGLDPAGTLRRVVGADNRIAPLPDSGMLVTAQLGRMLDVHPGDLLTVEVLGGIGPGREVEVAGLPEELLGVAAYMSLSRVFKLLDEPPTVTGAFLSVESDDARQLWARLASMPEISSVGLRAAQLEAFEKMNAETVLFFAGILVAFAVVIMAVVLFSTARICFAERLRELATLRLLGYGRSEVWTLLLGEIAVQLLMALPVGCLLGWAMSAAAARSGSSDLFRIPLVVEPATYTLAIVVAIATSAAVALHSRKIIAGMDLVAAMRTGD